MNAALARAARFLIAAVLFVVLADSPLLAAKGGRITWNRNYRQALEKARNEGRPLMIYFTAVNCPHCNKLDDGAFSDPEVSEKSNKFVTVLVQEMARESEEVMDQYKVRSYPTVLFVNPENEAVILKLDGRKADRVLDQMDEALKTKIRKPGKFQREQRQKKAREAQEKRGIAE